MVDREILATRLSKLREALRPKYTVRSRTGVKVQPQDYADMDQATREAVMAADGYSRAIISHGDLPLATDLTWLADGPVPGEVVIVPDRHGDGTNVLSVPLPLPAGFRFRYGVGSAAAHREEADTCRLPARTVVDERLGWDLDTPADLADWQRHRTRPTAVTGCE